MNKNKTNSCKRTIDRTRNSEKNNENNSNATGNSASGNQQPSCRQLCRPGPCFLFLLMFLAIIKSFAI